MKNRYLFKGLYILCVLFSVAVQAQNPTHPEMPKLTPLSPEAAAMSRYGEYPVSMFTGIPDISIPLFEIKTGKFSVPITLSYHAAGNKVNDIAPWVGLGWTLSSGGIITRKVMGKDDQNYTRRVPDASTLHADTASDHEFLEEVFNGSTVYDTEPDIYNFNFPGKSGSFIFKDPDTALM